MANGLSKTFREQREVDVNRSYWKLGEKRTNVRINEMLQVLLFFTKLHGVGSKKPPNIFHRGFT